jgi:uncharacterized protein (DUF1330 family)
MAAYVIANIEVFDTVGYEEYKNGIVATIAAYGGRFLTRGGATEVLEGEWTPKRLVMIEFPTMSDLKKWYQSPENRPFIAIRNRCTKSTLIAVEGNLPTS